MNKQPSIYADKRPLAALFNFFVILALLLIPHGQPSHADELSTNTVRGLDWIYTARAGDSLQSVAKTYLLQPSHWTDLLRYNNVSTSGTLPAGTTLKIPIGLLKHYPEPATLSETNGQVWYRKAHTASYVPAIKGLKLSVGDEIKTLQGQALIVFADASRLRISEKSIIIFNKLSHFGKTGMVDVRLRLSKGSIKTRVTPRKGPASRYEVSTPSAVAAVRGTAFRIRVINAYTIVEVTEGQVRVNNASNDLMLQKGQGVNMATGSALPVKLLPPPIIRKLPKTIGQLPLTISWQPITGAKTYRAEVFKDDPDTLPLISETHKDNSLNLSELTNGKYWVNVWAVDADNIEGLFANIIFMVDQQASPAVLRSPLAGAAADVQSPHFKWQLIDSKQLSRLEIAHNAEFTELHTKTAFDLQTSAAPEQPLPAGRYYWRVATMAGGENLAYSEARQVTINGWLAPTKVVAINYFNDQAKIYWKPVDNAKHYLVQLAEDEGFTRLVKEDAQQENSALLRLTPGKHYWVRVKGVGNQFYSSEFDRPLMLKIRP